MNYFTRVIFALFTLGTIVYTPICGQDKRRSIDDARCRCGDNAVGEHWCLCGETKISKTPKIYPIFIKTNLAFLATATANISVETPLAGNYSLDLPVCFSPYDLGDGYKYRILSFQPELRRWLSEPMRYHFIGIHTHLAWFNIATGGTYRYQDTRPLFGAGVSYGYALKLGNRLSGEFNIGVGYANIQYDTYYNVYNGKKMSSFSRDYWGITRVGINLIYRFDVHLRR